MRSVTCAYTAGRQWHTLRGQVAIAPEKELVKLNLRLNRGGPGTGVRVTATRSGKSYSTVVDADGGYELPLPEFGEYQVQASGGAFRFPPESVVHVPQRGCATHQIPLAIDNSISGRVWDHQGKTLSDAKVALINAEHGKRVLQEAYAGKSGIFTIMNILPGRYLLKFNPEGASDPLPGLPNESVYYPQQSTRASARIIEIKGSGNHLENIDLVMGARVPFRDLAVHVRFPDGAPMTTARVQITGEAVRPGAEVWERFIFGRKDGWAKTRVPADRKLRIEVTDLWGRVLTQPDRAEVEAGVSALRKDFVVQP